MEAFERDIYAHYFKLGHFRPMPNAPSDISLNALIEKYEAFFFDAFGTFYCRGETLYPGALEMYQKVRASGKPMRLVTNAASSAIPQFVESLNRMNIPFEESEIISSGGLFADFAKGKGIREAFYIGRPGGIGFLKEGGVSVSESPLENTVIISSVAENQKHLDRAKEILSRPDAKLIVLNPDAWAPRMQGPREGVSGCEAHKLFLEQHPETFYLGKPFLPIFEKALKSLPGMPKTIMIGDTLATDIGGALNAGIDAALLIGRNQPAAELASDEAFLKIRPTYYLRLDK